jgi:integrase/recombinase XerD
VVQILVQIFNNMENVKATANFLLDTRSEKKDGTYPIKLTIYFDGEKKRYKTGITITEENWTKFNVANLRDDKLKTVKRKLNLMLEKANSIFDSIEPFSFQGFESSYFEEKKVRKSSYVKDLFDNYIQLLEKDDKIGTAISYKTTKNSLTGFRNGIKITDVSKEFLRDYERYLTLKNLSSATISIYLRQIRRIVNLAINDGLLPVQKYPFKGYVIPVSRNVKKALSEEQVKSLLEYKTDIFEFRKALDYWLFSYLSNGINMTDVCLLKPSNLDTDFFHFYRAKTRNTKKKDLRPIKVPLTDLSHRIIEKWRNKNPYNPYLFPGKGLIRVLYTPFRVLCPVPFDNFPENTWIYVDEVCSSDKDELFYLIYGQPYSYKHFRLRINF